MTSDNILRKINYIDETKKQIKNTLNSKGISISDSEPFSSYAPKINQAKTGNAQVGINEGESHLSYMQSIKRINMAGWNTSRYRSFYHMFDSMDGLVEIDLTPLDMHSAEDIRGMFYNCERLKHVNLTPLSAAKYWRNGTSIFYHCRALETVIWPDHWNDTIEINDCSKMTKETIINLFNILNPNKPNKEVDISSTQSNMLSQSEKDIVSSKGWILRVI